MNTSTSPRKETRSADDETLPVIGITVSQFATMVGMSERSAWTVIKQEAEKAQREGRASSLPLIAPIEGGQIRRLRISDVTRWWNGLS